jgi:lysozyme
VRGLDVSHWNGTVDHRAAARGGIRFVIAKATQGTYLTDPRFTANVVAARAAGLVLGAYHFYDFRQGGAEQAAHFLRVLAAADALDDTLPPVVDIECFAPFGTADQAFVRRELRAFSDAIFAATGRLPMIYTSGHMWEEATGDDPRFGDHPLWVACWRCPEPYLPAGWDDWLVWQIGSMAIPGRTSRLDGDVFRGQERALVAARGPAAALVAPGGLMRRRIVTLLPAAFAGARVRVAIDGGRWIPWSSPDALPRLRLPDDDGPHRIRFQTRSARGVRGPVMTRIIRLDRHPPTVSMDRTSVPTMAGDATASPVTVYVRASDTSGVRSIAARTVCGVAIGAWRRVTGHRRSDVRLDVLLPADPGCRMEVLVRDAAGNRSHAWGGPWGDRLRAIERRDVMHRE